MAMPADKRGHRKGAHPAASTAANQGAQRSWPSKTQPSIGRAHRGQLQWPGHQAAHAAAPAAPGNASCAAPPAAGSRRPAEQSPRRGPAPGGGRRGRQVVRLSAGCRAAVRAERQPPPPHAAAACTAIAMLPSHAAGPPPAHPTNMPQQQQDITYPGVCCKGRRELGSEARLAQRALPLPLVQLQQLLAAGQRLGGDLQAGETGRWRGEAQQWRRVCSSTQSHVSAPITHVKCFHHEPGRVHSPHCRAAEEAAALRLHARVRQRRPQVRAQRRRLPLSQGSQRRVVGAAADALIHRQVLHLCGQASRERQAVRWGGIMAGGCACLSWHAHTALHTHYTIAGTHHVALAMSHK